MSFSITTLLAVNNMNTEFNADDLRDMLSASLPKCHLGEAQDLVANGVEPCVQMLADSEDEGVIEFLGEDGRAFLARLHEIQDAAPAEGERA